MTMTGVCIAAALLLTCVRSAAAQTEVLDSMRGRDAFVRFATDRETFSGRVARLTPDSVWLKVSWRAVPISAIRQIEGRVYQRDLLGNGALIGAGITGVVGWYVSGVCLDCPSERWSLWLGMVAMGTITGVLVDLAHEQFVWKLLWPR